MTERGGVVAAVDLDEDILQIAEQNARLNKVKVRFIQADIFAWLRDVAVNNRNAEDKRFDVVILDPAKMTRDREQVIPALKKYLDMNKLALAAVKPGGILLSCSCTGLVSEEQFLDMLRRAAFYANRTILKREVVPENVADAVYVLTGPELSRTTGLHIPVDSGVAAAFLR